MLCKHLQIPSVASLSDFGCEYFEASFLALPSPFPSLQSQPLVLGACVCLCSPSSQFTETAPTGSQHKLTGSSLFFFFNRSLYLMTLHSVYLIISVLALLLLLFFFLLYSTSALPLRTACPCISAFKLSRQQDDRCVPLYLILHQGHTPV